MRKLNYEQYDMLMGNNEKIFLNEIFKLFMVFFLYYHIISC